MQDTLEKNELNEIPASSELSEQQKKIKEAENKVAAMFAGAKTQSKQRRKKHDDFSSFELPNISTFPKQPVSTDKTVSLKKSLTEEPSEQLNNTENQETAPISDEALPSPNISEKDNTEKTAEEKLAELFASSSSENKKQGSFASLVKEITALECVSLLLFVLTMNSQMEGIALFAILLPALLGISYRIVKKQLSLREAVSQCRLHIILSCFSFICVILSV